MSQRVFVSLGKSRWWDDPAMIFELADTSVIDAAMAGLKRREASILRLRSGIGTNRCWTLEALAEKYGVTRERIRQIESKAVRKLRHPSCACELRFALPWRYHVR